MHPKNLSILIIIVFILSVLFLPALMGTGIFVEPDEDDLADDGDFSFLSHFSVPWIGIPAYQTLIPLWLGISIFALFLVYVGGRSKQKRFNDRTLDHLNVLMAEILKTAPIRAVFNFPFFTVYLKYPNKYFINFSSNPVLNLRRY